MRNPQFYVSGKRPISLKGMDMIDWYRNTTKHDTARTEWVIRRKYSRSEARWHAWWRHQMETFSALLAFCAGNSLVTGEFPSQRPETRSFDVWVNNRDTGDTRRHGAHCDVTVMCVFFVDNRPSDVILQITNVKIASTEYENTGYLYQLNNYSSCEDGIKHKRKLGVKIPINNMITSVYKI